jgi:two-component system alkaline phosphatase synthesis response regulator PhoP
MSSISEVLLVEDDDEIAAVTTEILAQLGLRTVRVADGLLGLEHGLRGGYAIIILDIRLPSLDGIEICRRVRAAGIKDPILMLTAETDETSTVLGLELGADDYVTKPFRAKELRARISALIRRSGSSTEASEVALSAEKGSRTEKEIVIGQLRLNLDLQAVFVDSTRVHVTPTEYRLLETLVQDPRRVFSADRLAEIVLGYVSHSDASTPVRAHVSRLRRKLAEAGLSGECIVNEQGFGYRFQIDS